MTQVISTDSATITESSPTKILARPVPGRAISWCVGASLLLLLSGIYHSVQASKYQEDKSYRVDSPFKLNTMPRTIGDWHVTEGGEINLDPLTTRITGSTDHILWSFADELTGVKLSLLLLFGPAEPVLPHNPQVCYPATGFSGVGPVVDKQLSPEGHDPMQFRTAIYAKPGGRTSNRTMVYHSYLFNGTWKPEVAIRNLPRRSPGIYKVQIQRLVTDNERREGDEPIEDFILKLVPILEKKIAEAAQSQTASAATPRL